MTQGPNELFFGAYEASLRPKLSGWMYLLDNFRSIVGLSFLMWVCWSEPWSAKYFGDRPWVMAIIMFIRGILAVEVIAYTYHRFFQHSFWMHKLYWIRRNQRCHWIHHMIIYPIGLLFCRSHEYMEAERGAVTAVVLALGAIVLFVWTHGINMLSVAFIMGLVVYAKCVVDVIHSRFHMMEHPWKNSRYFHWLKKIHMLHHWNHRTNFTLCHPAMDILFGTYASPTNYQEELRIVSEDRKLTASDFINWRYLLIKAMPIQYAAFISAASRHPPSLQKIQLILDVLSARIKAKPEDGEAINLYKRTVRLSEELHG